MTAKPQTVHLTKAEMTALLEEVKGYNGAEEKHLIEMDTEEFDIALWPFGRWEEGDPNLHVMVNVPNADGDFLPVLSIPASSWDSLVARD